MSASQDFRDGAATGASEMRSRLLKLSIWGVTLTDRVLSEVSAGIGYEYGGAANHPRRRNDDRGRFPEGHS